MVADLGDEIRIFYRLRCTDREHWPTVPTFRFCLARVHTAENTERGS
jgi:hypothetical protein